MKITKQKLIYALITLLSVVVIAAGTTVGLRTLHDSSAHSSTKGTIAQADALKAQAAQAKQTATANQLLESARQIYLANNNLNGVAGTDAQIYLINHPRQPSR